MQVKIMDAGPFGTNCYICINHGRALVIDPNFNLKPIIDALGGAKLEAILLTHAHIDHISALNELVLLYPQVPVYTHQKEEIYFLDPNYNLSSALLGVPYTYNKKLSFLEDKEEISLIGENIIVLHTPGHSLGSLSFFFTKEEELFSGDLLFEGSIGRTDFIGCDFKDLISSIKQKLFLLKESTTVYPGHGNTTTIGREKTQNSYIK